MDQSLAKLFAEEEPEHYWAGCTDEIWQTRVRVPCIAACSVKSGQAATPLFLDPREGEDFFMEHYGRRVVMESLTLGVAVLHNPPGGRIFLMGRDVDGWFVRREVTV